MAINITTFSVARTASSSTLTWNFSVSSGHDSLTWKIYGPNAYSGSGSGASSTTRTESGSAGDVHVWRAVVTARNTSLNEYETVERILGTSLLGNGVYVRVSDNWVPLNF
jgi:hypothetical protein